MTKDEYNKSIEDEYAKRVSEMSYEEIYDNYNPGNNNLCFRKISIRIKKFNIFRSHESRWIGKL